VLCVVMPQDSTLAVCSVQGSEFTFYGLRIVVEGLEFRV